MHQFDIRQIPGRFEARIALLTGLGNAKPGKIEVLADTYTLLAKAAEAPAKPPLG